MWIVAWRDMALWTVTSVCADRCNSTQFHCSRGNTCINADQECDGSTNCNDSSDEAQCCMLFHEIQYTFVSDSMIETATYACFLVCVFCCSTSPGRHWHTIITVWTVVQAVLTATFNSYGDRQISTPWKMNTPEPIDKKFGTVDYVREGTPYTKLDTNPPTGGFWANWWNITKNYFLFIPFFSGTRTGQTRGWIFTCDSSKDVKSRKDVSFGGLNDVLLNLG